MIYTFKVEKETDTHYWQQWQSYTNEHATRFTIQLTSWQRKKNKNIKTKIENVANLTTLTQRERHAGRDLAEKGKP